MGTLKASGYTTRQCQNQTWKPDPLAPLSFFQNICNFFKRSRVILGVRISKGPLFCFLPTLPTMFLLPLHSFSSPEASPSWAHLPEVRPPQAHSRPFPLPRPHLCLSQNCSTWSTRKIFTLFFFNTREICGRFYRWPVAINCKG